MTIETIEEKLKRFSGEVNFWWDRRSHGDLLKNNSQREEFIGILQERYGYTEQKAASEINKHYSKIILD